MLETIRENGMRGLAACGRICGSGGRSRGGGNDGGG